jgi:hypothetical protein
MNKEFCTYEQALALKELGFDEPCFGSYVKGNEYKDWTLYFEGGTFLAKDYPEFISVPLYQQAFRWFRDKHNLVFNFISYSIVKPGEYHWSITWHDVAKASGIVKTYEEAESASLDKLIEICKNK